MALAMFDSLRRRGRGRYETPDSEDDPLPPVDGLEEPYEDQGPPMPYEDQGPPLPEPQDEQPLPSVEGLKQTPDEDQGPPLPSTEGLQEPAKAAEPEAKASDSDDPGYLGRLLESIGDNAHAPVETVIPLGVKGVIKMQSGGGPARKNKRVVQQELGMEKDRIELQRARDAKAGQVTPALKARLDATSSNATANRYAAGLRSQASIDAMSEGRKQSQANSDRSFALQEAGEKRRVEGEARMAEGEKRRAMVAGRIPQSAAKEGIALLTTKKALDVLEQKLPEMEGKLGPLWGRVQAVGRPLGLDDPEVSAFRSELRNVLGNYLTAQTGAQRGMVEVRFLEDALPKIQDKSETFQSVMASFKDRIQRDLDTHREYYGAQGFDTSPLGESAPAAPTGGASQLPPDHPSLKQPALKAGDMYKGRRVLEVDPNDPTRIKVE